MAASFELNDNSGIVGTGAGGGVLANELAQLAIVAQAIRQTEFISGAMSRGEI